MNLEQAEFFTCGIIVAVVVVIILLTIKECNKK